MAGELFAYDPSIIERFAENLYRKAELFTAGAIVVGVIFGAAFGAIPLTSLGEYWPISSTFGFATMLLGAVVGGAVGYVVGDARAFGYRLHAQVALCQIEIERRTAETARTVAALAAVAAGPRAVPAPPVQQDPVALPTPAVAPAPPVSPAPLLSPAPAPPMPAAAVVEAPPVPMSGPPAPPLLRPPAA